MRRLARLIFNRWVLGAVGLLAAGILIWWVGPLVAIKNFYPFESEWVRWIQIAVLVLTPIGRLVLRFVRARKANASLMSGLLQPAPGQTEAPPDPSAPEVAQLRQRFEEAVGLLRKRHFGGATPSLWARIRSFGSRQYLYDLPWYVFIGAPGAGKTTALINSGLRFPLAGTLGREAVRGVGGTRDCDWWFTDEAVFLDTAGRYTTQQSHQEVDAGAWKGFLQLLKRSRPRRPINGVLVTLSIGDLLQESPAERATHTEAIRARVRELYEELGVRFPVYMLVTKSDLVAGFSEFFAALGKEERAQVWGITLPYGDQRFDPAALSGELEGLERRLYERLPDRLEEEREPGRRALLYAFPQQFALLRSRLVDFVERAFAPTQFESSALLRGVYFTSGTQEGSPIDRVMGAFARELGLERRLLAAQQPSGRSYFLTRLLREVVFREAGLAGINLRGERRRQLIQTGAIGAAAAVLVLATAGWWISYAHNREYLAEVAAQLEPVKKQVAATRAGAKTDLAGLLPTLTAVRTLSETRATPDGAVPWSWRLGLYQGGKLEAASRAAYRRMLQDTFLPSMAAYLDRFLRQDGGGRAQEESYDALKAYVMLYDPRRFNRDAVWRWYERRTSELLPGAGADEQKALKAHFEMLYERGWVDPALARDDALLAQVRAVVGRDSLPKRIYDRLKRERVPELRDFTITEKAGPKAMLVFERASREPLTKGVPGLYTKDAYYRHVLKRVEVTAIQMAEEEAWVLGTGAGPVAQAISTFPDAVKRLYLEDYRRIWRQFINDITLVGERDLTRMIEVTRTLSGPDTPLRPLVKAIDRETTLSVPPEGDPGLVGTVTGKAQEYVGKARQSISGSAADLLAKSLVDDQFEDIHRLAGGAGGNPPPALDATVQQLNDFYQFLVAAKVALDAGQALPPADAATKLRAEAARLPEPIRSMVQGLVEGSTRNLSEKVRLKQAEDARILRDKQAEEARIQRDKQVAEIRQTRERIDAELRSQVADFCVRAINGRYPFVRGSSQDVTPDDFGRLFAPGGVLDGFFLKNLAAHVDTSRKPWQFKDATMGSSAALAEFQRAQMIRDVFFRGGGSTPSIQLDFKPLEMDASIRQFVLDVDGKIVRYAHGPQLPVRVQFPGPSGRSQVRLSISPPPPSGSNARTFDGPWALFRMFDEVNIQATNQFERFVAPISVEGRRAVFEILASSVRNPFRLPELNEFHCPTAL